MRVPRARVTIRGLMTIVVLSALILAVSVTVRERRRRAVALQLAVAETALAEADLARSADRLKWSPEMAGKGYVSEAQRVADRHALDRARLDVEQARTKRDELLRSTGLKAR